MQRPPLMTNSGFAFATMSVRLPAVIRTVARTNAKVYSAEILADIEAFAVEVESGAALRALKFTEPDNSFDQLWHATHLRFGALGWHAVPWYQAEAYMYRCLLEVVGYYDHNAPVFYRLDPFQPQKAEELTRNSTTTLLRQALVASAGNNCEALLTFCVLGNKADLCYTKVSSTLHSGLAAPLLVNDAARVCQHIAQAPAAAVFSVICDNAGTELLCDLVLIDWLLHGSQNESKQHRVELFTKRHPTFVSDVTPEDVDTTIQYLCSSFEENDACRLFGLRLRSAIQSHRLLIVPHEFFNGPQFFDQLPESIHFRAAHLTIFKGDANYRRLLIDHRWPVDTPFEVPLSLIPSLHGCSLVCLRTCKSDPIVGLALRNAEELEISDAEWRVNGVRGLIQARLM